MMTEPDLVTVHDEAAIDDASLICHRNTRGHFSLDPLVVGRGCVMRSGSRCVLFLLIICTILKNDNTYILLYYRMSMQKSTQLVFFFLNIALLNRHTPIAVSLMRKLLPTLPLFRWWFVS